MLTDNSVGSSKAENYFLRRKTNNATAPRPANASMEGSGMGANSKPRKTLTAPDKAISVSKDEAPVSRILISRLFEVSVVVA